MTTLSNFFTIQIKYIGLIVFVLCLCECYNPDKKRVTKNKKHTDEYIRLKIDIPGKEEVIDISSLAKGIKYIKLETNDSCLIGRIKKVLVFGDKYVIRSKQGVHIFYKSGKFYKKIPKGRGPKEIESPADILISGNKLEVMDYIKSNIQIYDQDLNYKGEIHIPIRGIQFQKLNSKIYVIYNGNISGKTKSYAYLFNTEKRTVLKYILPGIPAYKNYRVLTDFNLNSSDDGILINTPYSDTVYLIKENLEIKPAYYFDYGKDKLPEDYIRENKDVDITKTMKFNKSANGVRSLIVSNPVMYFRFNYPQNGLIQGMNLIDAKRIVLLEKASWLIKEYIRFYPAWPLGKFDGGLIYALDPGSLLEGVENMKEKMDKNEWEKFSKEHKELLGLSKYASATDNPILVLVTF